MPMVTPQSQFYLQTIIIPTNKMITCVLVFLLQILKMVNEEFDCNKTSIVLNHQISRRRWKNDPEDESKQYSKIMSKTYTILAPMIFLCIVAAGKKLTIDSSINQFLFIKILFSVFTESGLLVEFTYETQKQLCTEYFEDFTNIPNIYKYECFWGSIIPVLTLILGLFYI